METIIEGEGEENRSSKRKNDENVLIEKEYMYEYKQIKEIKVHIEKKYPNKNLEK